MSDPERDALVHLEKLVREFTNVTSHLAPHQWPQGRHAYRSPAAVARDLELALVHLDTARAIQGAA